jgi:hypothetical protein
MCRNHVEVRGKFGSMRRFKYMASTNCPPKV